MKILKPSSLALLYRSIHLGHLHQLSIGMMACFTFDKNNLPDLLPEAKMWPLAVKAMGKNAILDEGFPKPVGEFLVFGAAYAPVNTPATEVVVAAQIGTLKKALFVRGDRHFNALGLISAPKAFAFMPITPATAFGGQGSLDNPWGKGLHKVLDADGGSRLPLPNVETASTPILGAGDVAPPAGFWAYGPDAPERSRHLGEFGQPWLKQTWPHLPDTTDLAYFQTAPLDQRLPGFFQGDEPIQLLNMHPTRPLIASSLPKLRARCFINRRVAGGEEFTELQTRAETVWLFPELECGIVLYRAVANTSDEDADDVLHLMAQWESLADWPRSFDDYHDEFRRRLLKKTVTAAAEPVLTATVTAVAEVIAEPAAVGAISPEALAIEAENFLAQSPELQAVHRLAAELEKNSQALMQEHGITAADLAPYLKKEPEPPDRTLAQVEQMAADLNTQSRALMQQHNISDQDLEPFLPKPEVEPANVLGDLEKALIGLTAHTQAVMRQTGVTQADVDAFMASTPELAHMVGMPMPDIKTAMAGLAAVMPLSAPPKAEPPAEKTEPVPTMPARKLTRDEVVARHALQQGFSSLDLSGLDLSGLDLTGADFSSALLEKTYFKDSCLAGVNFSHALVAGSDFSGADLSRAAMAEISAGAAVFTKARMDGVDASKGDFTGADLSGVQIAKAKLGQAIFDSAKMAGVQAAGCTAQQASFAGCDLTGADFTNAQLKAASFSGAQLGKAIFTASTCDNAEFYGVDASAADFTGANLRASRADASSQFAGAVLTQADMARASWGGVLLGKALLDGATLDDADFSGVQAAEARFGRASAKGTRFDKANLTGADFTGVNLFKGSLRKAILAQTLLRKANLYGVDFYGTSPTISSLEGSNIDQTLLVIRAPLV